MDDIETTIRQTTRPRIGIAATSRELPMPPGPCPAQTVLQPFVDAVLASGGLPVLLPIIAPELAGDLVGAVDALLLTGGADLDPSLSGAVRDRATCVADPTRDPFELALVRAAREISRPTLGICRGLQVVNIAFGGTLRGEVDGHLGGELRHDVAVIADSMLGRAVGETTVETNSLHHQAVDRLGDGLRITARCADGIVEAIEPIDPEWPAVGLQWHPELDPTPTSAAIFSWLTAAGAASKRERRP